MKKLFCLLLALLTIGGCALAETENKTDEAVLNVFTWEGYIDYSTVIKPFEEETGIKVNYATFSSNEEMYEKLSAVNGGDYDVVLASDYMLNTTREAGLMQPFDPAIVDNYSNLNAGFTHQFFDPDNQYVVPYVSGIPLIVYDPSAVEIDIKGFNDLWDPSLEDSLGLIDDARVTIGMVLLSMHQSMNTTDDAVLAEAAEKLDALRGNIHVLEYENLHNYLVSGDIAVAYTFTPFVALALDANPDLKVVWPEEGLGFGIDGFVLTAASQNVESAHAFLNYLMDARVAAHNAEYQAYMCVNKAAEAELSADYWANPAYNPPEEMLKNAEYVMNIGDAESAYADIYAAFKLQ